MWEIFSNTCLCQHLLKSDMSDAVKDNTQNALRTVTIPPVVLNLSTRPKSSNKNENFTFKRILPILSELSFSQIRKELFFCQVFFAGSVRKLS